jgi:tetratricopeptide (TPR) repeat protein
VTAKRRALLHVHAGEALLRRYGDEAAPLAALLAMHFEQARDFERATVQLVQAGDNAMSLFAAVEAERHFARALECAARLPAPRRARELVAIHRRRALALTAMGRYDGAVDDLTHALDQAREASDPALEGETHVAMADALIASHALDRAEPHVQAARDIAEREGLPALRVDALAMRALERLVVGDLDECRRALDGIAEPQPLALHLTGLLHYFWSEYPAAERAFRRAAEDNERALADGLLLMESQMFGALAVANQGRLGEALRGLRATMDLAKRNESAGMLARAGNSVGWIYRELGMLDRAVEEDERAAERGREAGETEAEANALVNLAEDAITSGTAAGVSERFERVAELGRADAWLRWRYGLRLEAARARERLARGTPPEAVTAARALRERAAAQRAAKYVALGWEIEARALLAAGDPAAAARAIEAARSELDARPAPLVGWRVEALAAEIADRAGDGPSASRARARAAETVASIAAGLAPPERAAFESHAAARARST